MVILSRPQCVRRVWCHTTKFCLWQSFHVVITTKMKTGIKTEETCHISIFQIYEMPEMRDGTLPLISWYTRQFTHFPLSKMDAISQTTFSNAFSLMKSFVFRLEFRWSSLLRVQLTISQYWFRYGLAPNRRQAIAGTNADPVQCRIYAALGGDELITIEKRLSFVLLKKCFDFMLPCWINTF